MADTMAMGSSGSVNWDNYRKCTVCLQPTGAPCKATSGRVSHGRPDGVAVDLAVPHPSRQLRKRRKAAG